MGATRRSLSASGDAEEVASRRQGRGVESNARVRRESNADAHYLPIVEHKPDALRNGTPCAGMPDPPQRLRRTLFGTRTGTRSWTRCLMTVRRHGLAAVLVAVKLPALEVITRHNKHVRFYSPVELVNTLKQEKANGQAEGLSQTPPERAISRIRL